ncbi:hypothetical protein BMQ_pBM40016 (plasmid) [Priestia megaterium QM B1551]|uniref:Uncharacterized protein n=1 Tax=Priestia megaterium (strain ATCC 12872 / QMB1551) TaxID=545693 RepID=D5E3D3_PRIM1|nr:hypothetical protein BMQ_pBM40016 [Priestia megaterium QM B1551]
MISKDLFKFAFLNNMVFMVLIKLTFLETTICLCYKDNFLLRLLYICILL